MCGSRQKNSPWVQPRFPKAFQDRHPNGGVTANPFHPGGKEVDLAAPSTTSCVSNRKVRIFAQLESNNKLLHVLDLLLLHQQQPTTTARRRRIALLVPGTVVDTVVRPCAKLNLGSFFPFSWVVVGFRAFVFHSKD